MLQSFKIKKKLFEFQKFYQNSALKSFFFRFLIQILVFIFILFIFWFFFFRSTHFFEKTGSFGLKSRNSKTFPSADSLINKIKASCTWKMKKKWKTNPKMLFFEKFSKYLFFERKSQRKAHWPLGFVNRFREIYNQSSTEWDRVLDQL